MSEELLQVRRELEELRRQLADLKHEMWAEQSRMEDDWRVRHGELLGQVAELRGFLQSRRPGP
jgi:hypothetical protein